jgi:phosphatidylserine synthase 2
LWGAVGLRETFQLLDDPECDRLGRQSWVLVAIVSTEFMICVKFGWATITKPLPRSIALWWLAGLAFLVCISKLKFH